MNRDVEILAPAGSMECLRAAVAAGADAIYLGGTKFGARAYAQNLSEEDLVQAIEYVHIHGRKIYMTVNTLLKDRELNELYAYLLPYYKAGLDGVIVQDIGAVKFIGNAGSSQYTDDDHQYTWSRLLKKIRNYESCTGKRTFFKGNP